MTWPIWTALLVSATALVSSIGAWLAALRLLAHSRLNSASVLSAQLSELTLTVESLTQQLRNVRSRLNMRAYRARQEAQSDPPSQETRPETDEERARLRAELNATLAKRNGP
jgi:hypothetical protein